MTIRQLTLAASATAIALAAAPAMAEITAEQVWDTQMKVYEDLGFTLTGEQIRDGDTLTVTGAGGDYTLPFDLGRLSFRMSDQILIEQEDGTVAHDLSAPGWIELSADIEDRPGAPIKVSARVSIDWSGATSIASELPEGLRVDTTAQSLIMRLTALDAPDTDDLSLNIMMVMNGLDSRMDILGPDARVIESTASVRELITDMQMETYGVDNRDVSQQLDLRSITKVTLPSTPVDVMNLGAALRDGLAISVSGPAGRMVSQSVTRYDGDMMSNQSQELESSIFSFALDRAGIRLDGQFEGMRQTVMDGFLGLGDIAIEIASGHGALSLPLLAGPERQHATLDLTLNGIGADEQTWTMATIAPELRGIADLSLSLGVSGQILHDLTDAEGLIDSVDKGTPFLRLFDVTLNNLALSYQEASIAGSGRVHWDPDGALVNPEMPAPQGQARFVLNGFNALIERIGQSGMLDGSMMMGLRGGLAAGARPIGPDQYESVVELGPNERLTVNGAPVPF